MVNEAVISNSEPLAPTTSGTKIRFAAPMRDRSWWLNALCITLLGYALFGRGWAYFPGPPFFIGEIILGLGVITVFLGCRWSGLLTSWPFLCLAALGTWGLVRTLPYVSQYGAESLRDAMIWAYGLYAVIVFCYLQSNPQRLVTLVHRYQQFCWIFPCLLPLVWVATHDFEASLPRWPWADVTVIDAKGGDVLVHLAGVLAFFVSGLAGRVSLWRLVLLAGSICLIGSYNRGGLVTVLMVTGACAMLKPRNEALWRVATVIACALVLLAATGVKMSLEGKQRELSFDQLVTNMASVAVDTGNNELNGTRNWRLNWWGDIYQYTVNGRYFWEGKGFGVNLADDDGYQGISWEEKLRSPHNGHMNFLARAGVPGFVLWFLTQLTWLWTVGSAYLHSRRHQNRAWSNLLFFLLVFWLAFIVNISFDVYLEGPMGGIWFWTVFGVGLSAASTYERDPHVFPQGTAA